MHFSSWDPAESLAQSTLQCDLVVIRTPGHSPNHRLWLGQNRTLPIPLELVEQGTTVPELQVWPCLQLCCCSSRRGYCNIIFLIRVLFPTLLLGCRSGNTNSRPPCFARPAPRPSSSNNNAALYKVGLRFLSAMNKGPANSPWATIERLIVNYCAHSHTKSAPQFGS